MSNYVDNIIIGNAITKLQYELVYTSSFLCLNRDDIISIFLNKDLNKWSFHLRFVEFSGEDVGRVKMDIDKDNNIVLTHYNWYGDDWLEYSEPMSITSKDKSISLLVKLKSIAVHAMNNRTVEISIWKQTPSQFK